MALPPGPSRARRPASRAGAAFLAWLAILAVVPGHGQETDPAERAAQRIKALQREAEDLASRERTLLEELRAIEVQREIEVGRLREAERQLAGIEADLADEPFRGRADLGRVPDHGHAGPLRLGVIEAELNGLVAVRLLRLDLEDGAGTGLDDGGRHHLTGFVIDAGHTHFLA